MCLLRFHIIRSNILQFYYKLWGTNVISFLSDIEYAKYYAKMAESSKTMASQRVR